MSSSSLTAYNVICALDKLAKIDRWKKFFNPETIRLNSITTAHTADSFTKRVLSILPPRIYLKMMDMVFVTGMSYNFLFRKLYIEQYVHRAIADGIKQVLALGAGNDMLLLRLANEYKDVRFVEIDLPVTQRKKIELLDSIAYYLPANHSFLEADLSLNSLSDALAKLRAFSAKIPTLIIIEGVLMYLSESEVKSLFWQIKNIFSNKLEIIFGAIAQADQQNNLKTRLMDRFLSKKGEQTKWYCPSSQMPDFVKSLGFSIKEWIEYKELQKKYRTANEIKNIPDEDENYYIVAN